MNHSNHISGRELRRSLNLVILGVAFGIVFFVVLNGAPLTGFIRALGAGDLLYSFIMALPLLGSVGQFLAAYFLENTGKRKLLFLISGFMRLLWVPVALLPLLMPSGLSGVRTGIITFLIALWALANAVTGITFSSWMGDLVPEGIRGRFFGRRMMIFTIMTALSGLAIGKYLDSFHDYKGFAILFGIVTILGVADISCFFGVKDPPMPAPETKIPFRKLCLLPFQDKNYFMFLLFIAIWNFGMNFAAPFFNVYMLEQLHMNYFSIFLGAQLVSNLATVLFVQVWGKMTDKFGNKPVMVICSSVVMFLPMFWCFATPQNHLIVIPIINLLAGSFWPGYDISATNLAIWLAPPRNRSIYIATYTVFASLIGGMSAYICGGALMEFSKGILAKWSLPFFLGQRLTNFHCLFITAALFRILAALIFLPRFSEKHSNPIRIGRILQDFQRNLREKISARNQA
ncbi:MAG: MFS transporter [Firmicutes bacterium]|nr:MFS transporter [Bacillota bacterium]